MTVNPRDDSLAEKIYHFELDVFLTSNPAIVLTEAFTVRVNYCVPTLTKNSDLKDFTYLVSELFDNTVVKSWPTYSQENASCGYPVTYRFLNQDDTVPDS